MVQVAPDLGKKEILPDQEQRFATLEAAQVVWLVFDPNNEDWLSPGVPISIEITGPTFGAVGASLNFIASVEPITTVLPLTYTWQATGQVPLICTSGLTDTAAFSWVVPGLYTITVTAMNNLGQVVAVHTIDIQEPIMGLEAINDSPTTFAQTTTLTATVSSGRSITYTWNFGDESMGYGAIVPHNYLLAGVYTATVMASNGLGSQVAQTMIEIEKAPYSLFLPYV